MRNSVLKMIRENNLVTLYADEKKKRNKKIKKSHPGYILKSDWCVYK